METAETVIRIAFTFGGWVFGGYVRDVMVRNSGEFSDVDIMFPSYTCDLEHFVKVLNAVFGKEVQVFSEQSFPLGMYMSDKIIRRIFVTVKGVAFDFCLYSGKLEDWKKERSTDFTCNLFYASSEVDLGIRYIPEHLKLTADPIDELLMTTRQNKFRVAWEGQYTMEKLNRLAVRAITMKEKGWSYPSPLFSAHTWTWIDAQGPEEVSKWPILEGL